MTVVIDVGCARYGGDFSVERLLAEYDPDFLFGFDPNWKPEMFVPGDELRTRVDISTEAAWTYDGESGFASDGLNSRLTESGERVACIDLARWLWEELPAVRLTDGHRHKVVLKVDAEGSEYELLEHLHAERADNLIHVAWVEWHAFGVPNPTMRRRWIEQNLRCQFMEWRW